VVRGGSWRTHPWEIRSASRQQGGDGSSSFIGFRVARVLE
jgi:formylglycine-generating enzyme required for sulfatase activity